MFVCVCVRVCVPACALAHTCVCASVCVCTFHHGDGVLYLGLQQVDSHHGRQVLHAHLVHLGLQLHLEQEPRPRFMFGILFKNVLYI